MRTQFLIGTAYLTVIRPPRNELPAHGLRADVDEPILQISDNGDKTVWEIVVVKA